MPDFPITKDCQKTLFMLYPDRISQIIDKNVPKLEFYLLKSLEDKTTQANNDPRKMI